jgi:hypothetical protein
MMCSGDNLRAPRPGDEVRVVPLTARAFRQSPKQASFTSFRLWTGLIGWRPLGRLQFRSPNHALAAAAAVAEYVVWQGVPDRGGSDRFDLIRVKLSLGARNQIKCQLSKSVSKSFHLLSAILVSIHLSLVSISKV